MWELLGPIFGMMTSAAGAYIGSQYNQNAANTATAAEMQSAQQRAQGIQQEQSKLTQLEAENQPGQNYLRDVVAGSGELNPAQKKQLEDLRRNETNQLRTSAIAGSGRAASALFRDTEDRFTLDALDRNRQLAYGAAGQMANRGFQAGTGVARGYADIGNAYGNATRESGLIQAEAGLASGKLWGSAIGGIGSAINRGSSKFRASSWPSNSGGSSGGTAENHDPSYDS